MARDDKPLKLRMVDDSQVEPLPAIRLENRETLEQAKERNPVRLGSAGEPAEFSWRLSLPDRDEAELRTYQPGIEVLIEPPPSAPELVEENWGAATVRHHPVPWGWFALIALVIAGAVLWSLSRVGNAGMHADQIRETTQSVLVDEEQEQLEAAQLIDRIDQTIRDFAKVTSTGGFARLIRQPERVMPLILHYYGDQPVALGHLKSIRMMQPITVDNRGNFWAASVVLGKDKVRNLVLEIGANGEPRVDWETFVCYQPMKWDDFARERPTGAALDFRVFAQADNFYNHEFGDSDRWVCFRLTAMDGEQALFGYARVGSPEAVELLKLVQSGGGGSVSVMLRLGVPAGLRSRRGVVIEKLVSPRWLFVDPPDSGS